MQIQVNRISGISGEVAQVLAGKAPDPYGMRETFWSAFAHELFSKISEAYIAKSKGGSDELGHSWKPLSRKTVAYRDSKHDPAPRGESGRGLLTHYQLSIWRAVFSAKLKRLSEKVGADEAARQAARSAWNILKAKYGAVTKIGTLADRKVLIMRVTDALLLSVSPGAVHGTSYQPTPGQIFELRASSMILGTKVPYAEAASRDRPIWPSSLDRDQSWHWSQGWFSQAVYAGLQAVSKIRR